MIITLVLFYGQIHQLQPLVPFGNDPITHLELISHLERSPWQTIRLADYPLGFHLIAAGLISLLRLPVARFFVLATPLLYLLPLLVLAAISKRLFGRLVSLLVVLLALLSFGFSYLGIGAYPAIVANQTLVPLLFVWLYLLFFEPNSSQHKWWHALSLGLLAGLVSLMHWMALPEFLGYTVIAGALSLKQVRHNSRYLGLILGLIVGINIIAGLVNPSLISPRFLAHAEQSLQGATQLNQDYLTYSRLSLFSRVHDATGGNNVDKFLSFPLTYLLYASLPIAIWLLWRAELPPKTRQRYGSLVLIVALSLGCAVLPWTPYGGRIVSDLVPFVLVVIAASAVLAVRTNAIYLSAIMVIMFIAVSPELNPLDMTTRMQKMLNHDTAAERQLQTYLETRYPDGATIVAPYFRMYLPYFLPPKYHIIGPSRFTPLTTVERQEDIVWRILVDDPKSAKLLPGRLQAMHADLVIFQPYFADPLLPGEDTSSIVKQYLALPLCQAGQSQSTTTFTGLHTMFIICDKRQAKEHS